MKRTGEYVLGIIGVILSILTIGIGLIFTLFKNDEVRETITEDEAFANDPEMLNDLNAFLDTVSGFGWLVVVAAIAGVVFGLIAIFVLKSKKNTAAGILFLIAAVVVGLLSVGIGFLPAILFLIVGIMCLVRKEKIDTNKYVEM